MRDRGKRERGACTQRGGKKTTGSGGALLRTEGTRGRDTKSNSGNKHEGTEGERASRADRVMMPGVRKGRDGHAAQAQEGPPGLGEQGSAVVGAGARAHQAWGWARENEKWGAAGCWLKRQRRWLRSRVGFAAVAATDGGGRAAAGLGGARGPSHMLLLMLCPGRRSGQAGDTGSCGSGRTPAACGPFALSLLTSCWSLCLLRSVSPTSRTADNYGAAQPSRSPSGAAAHRGRPGRGTT